VEGEHVTRQPFGEPSRFWQQLATEHARDLERYGADAIKRHQALRYFTWGWRWRSLRESRQMRYLLAHSAPSSLARALVTPASLADADWTGVSWSRRDRWLYTFATRLLWEHARRHDTFRVLDHPEPELGRPLPVNWRGRLISQDLANAALEATAVGRALDGTQPSSIVEVGAGYGRTAYALLNSFPDATYTIVDIEPALSIARWYLEQLFPRERLRFLAPDETNDLADGSIDLVVSISSLHEMRLDQVERYLELFDRIAQGGTVYLKQWSRWANPADGITVDFAEYPIPPAWTRLFNAAAPVQTNFRQAAWKVPATTDAATRHRGARADSAP
jgi:putative sugar O-methyltransferase